MKHTKPLWIFLPLLALMLLIAMLSCKTERVQSALGPHPEGWMDAANPNFHGVPAQRDSSNNCRACHGQDLTGGTSGISCSQCHLTLPHPANWMDTTSTGFHGVVARQDSNSNRNCAACHGADFRGGTSGVSCRGCHAPYPHADELPDTSWVGPLVADTVFHGWVAMSDTAGPGTSCTPCHGADYHGTSRAPTCFECHTMLHVDVENEDTSTHREFVASKNWKITTVCAVCHDTSFSGGRAATVDDAAVCTQCHNPSDDTMKLTGCNVCHTDDPSLRPYWKLPYGMDASAVGAHPTHVTENGYACRECHPSLSASGHPHALPADVAFVTGRTRFSNLFGMQPVFSHQGAANSGNGQCSNVYCHTDGVQPNPGPPVAFPQWTSSGFTCGTCHRFPPAAPHRQDEVRCHLCHGDVDPTSNYNYPVPDSIRFIPDSLHVDGLIEGA